MADWDLAHQDLTNALFTASNLADANLTSVTARDADFSGATLTNANLTGADLTGAQFEGANVQGTQLAGAIIIGANFREATSHGLTKEQLYTTASFTSRNLRGTVLRNNDLTGWNFAGQNLTDANFEDSVLFDANFTDATIAGADFEDTGAIGFTKDMLYSTASYRAKLLMGINLEDNQMDGWDFSNQNLADADLRQAVLTGANLSNSILRNANLQETQLENANLRDAVVSGTDFRGVQGLTQEQLYSTLSYKLQDLTAIQLRNNDLTGWNFAGQNLTDANFEDAIVANIDLTGAIITGVDFEDTELTATQLYSTNSYQVKDLSYVNLEDNVMIGWNFTGQDLTQANFEGASLGGANFRDAILRNVDFEGNTRLNDADFTGADLAHGKFSLVTIREPDGDREILRPNLRGARLQNANLERAVDLSEARFDANTEYNQWTVFPDDFDPKIHGLTLVESSRGDFNANGVLDSEDVDWLAERIRPAVPGFGQSAWLERQGFWDLNDDGIIDTNDHHHWVANLKGTYFGDSNLDGVFDSSDLVMVFQAGQYDDSVPMNSNWATGDWNGDSEFDSGDLVLAFQDGGFELGPGVELNPVSEPSTFGILAVASIGIVIVARRKSG